MHQRHQPPLTRVDDLAFGESALQLAVPADQRAEPEEPADRDTDEEQAVDQGGEKVVGALGCHDGVERGIVGLGERGTVARGRLGCPRPRPVEDVGGAGRVGPRQGLGRAEDRAGVVTRPPGRERGGEAGLGHPLLVGAVVEVVDRGEEDELREHDQQCDRDREGRPGARG